VSANTPPNRPLPLVTRARLAAAANACAPQLPATLPARQPVPTRSNAPHPTRGRKTNPTSAPAPFLHPPSSPSKRPRPLTPAQLRAARLWLAGHSPAAIAQTLAVTTHTFARWKRRPDFQAELRRLLDHPTSDNSTVA
jgi:hypothetical protein